MTTTFVTNLFYLVGAVCFIRGLRLMNNPDAARRGNFTAGAGMALVVIAALLEPIPGAYNNYAWIAGGLVLGIAAGYFIAMKPMTSGMPPAIALFNGLGSACAVALSLAEILLVYNGESAASRGVMALLLLTILIGGVAFSGSLAGYARLNHLVKDGTLTLNRHGMVSLLLLVIALFWGVFIYLNGERGNALLVVGFIFAAAAYGILLAAPVQSRDLGIFISLLNALSGISAATAGLAYGSRTMLIAGIFVGTAGTLLTFRMCRAANRSLTKVLSGDDSDNSTEAFPEASPSAGDAPGEAKEISLANAAALMSFSQSVIFVPGYGFAEAQAQHVCRETGDLLQSRGIQVQYAVHPVAGRTPGQLQQLLTEAGVAPTSLPDLNTANEMLEQADLAIVIGANDVVNPAAENDPSCALYGMPVLKVWQARQVITIKRSTGAGRAGVANPLFFHERNSMLFGDATAVLSKLNEELKNQ